MDRRIVLMSPSSIVWHQALRAHLSATSRAPRGAQKGIAEIVPPRTTSKKSGAFLREQLDATTGGKKLSFTEDQRRVLPAREAGDGSCLEPRRAIFDTTETAGKVRGPISSYFPYPAATMFALSLIHISEPT